MGAGPVQQRLRPGRLGIGEVRGAVDVASGRLDGAMAGEELDVAQAASNVARRDGDLDTAGGGPRMLAV